MSPRFWGILTEIRDESGKISELAFRLWIKGRANVDAILANHSTLMNHALWPEYVGKLAKGVRYLGMPKVS